VGRCEHLEYTDHFITTVPESTPSFHSEAYISARHFEIGGERERESEMVPLMVRRNYPWTIQVPTIQYPNSWVEERV
jgi:hypothetical protein